MWCCPLDGRTARVHKHDAQSSTFSVQRKQQWPAAGGTTQPRPDDFDTAFHVWEYLRATHSKEFRASKVTVFGVPKQLHSCRWGDGETDAWVLDLVLQEENVCVLVTIMTL